MTQDFDLYFQTMELVGLNDETITFNVEYEMRDGTLLATPHAFKINGKAMMLSDLNSFDRELVAIEVENERDFRDRQYGEQYLEAIQAAKEQQSFDMSRDK